MRSAALAVALGAAFPSFAFSADPEAQLLTAVEDWRSGRVHDALTALDRLVKQQPNFRLAQLLYGDLLAARAGSRRGPAVDGDDPRMRELMDEAQLRLSEWRTAPPPGALPDSLLQLTPRARHAVVIDLARARLYLLEQKNGQLAVLRHFYAGIGKNGARKQAAGDNRTPVGVYKITNWIDGRTLPDLYGAGAFPLDYPNVWDQRQRKTGSGIWLHGVPTNTYVRAPRSSEGCVTLANADLLALKPYLVPGNTPVVLSDSLRWVAHHEAQAFRQEFLDTLERWRERWSARDTRGYLEFYADDFAADGMNRKAFASYKQRVNEGKKHIEVRLRDVELFRYPGDEPLMLTRFTQDYRSDNFARTTQKQQFWRREAGGWKILVEENL